MKVKLQITHEAGTEVTVENPDAIGLSEVVEVITTGLTAAWGYEIDVKASIPETNSVFSRDGQVG
jgi:hypothetical protein